MKNYSYLLIVFMGVVVPGEMIPNSTISPQKKKEMLTDVVVFSYDRPLQLYAFLESLEKLVTGVNQITVIYRVSSEKYADAYNIVKDKFASVNYWKQSSNPRGDFKVLTNKAAFDREYSSVPFILFAVDDIVVKDEINLAHAVSMLKETHAYGLYFRLGDHTDYSYMGDYMQGIPQSCEVAEEVYAWRFDEGRGYWHYPNTVDMTLYRKIDIEKDFRKMNFYNPNKLEGDWNLLAEYDRVGLYYSTSKIVNLPLNTVRLNSPNRATNSYSTNDLLKLFNAGKKLDISRLYHIRNRSAHIDFEVEFIQR